MHYLVAFIFMYFLWVSEAKRLWGSNSGSCILKRVCKGVAFERGLRVRPIDWPVTDKNLRLGATTVLSCTKF